MMYAPAFRVSISPATVGRSGLQDTRHFAGTIDDAALAEPVRGSYAGYQDGGLLGVSLDPCPEFGQLCLRTLKQLAQ